MINGKFRYLRTPFDTAVIMISKETNALESARTWLKEAEKE